jgi:hypothetical protein
VRLDRVRIPDASGAEERSWQVVSAAFEARVAAPRRPAWRGPLALAAAVLALAAAALSPPGRAVIDSARKAIGVEHATPALFRLPAPGRLLVSGSGGTWIVQQDGSKRLLGDYSDSDWSPHGLFVVAARTNELATLEPGGKVHWTLARRNVRLPSWGGSRTDTRIAYLSGSRLHVVAGDGTGDVDACGEPAAAPVRPAWRPGARHVLAFATTQGRVLVLDTDSCSLLWRSARLGHVRALAWSPDAARLAVATGNRLVLLDGFHPQRPPVELRKVLGVAFGSRLAVVQARSVLVLDGKRISVALGGQGPFTDAAWSPDGRWLAVSWPAADQWVFVRMRGARMIEAVGHIREQFGGFPRLTAWCCPPS